MNDPRRVEAALAANVREWRTRRGWSQSELAARAGLSKGMLVQVEQARHHQPDGVLQDHQRHEQDQQDHQLLATASQRTNVCAQAQRGEEREQQRLLQRLVHREVDRGDETHAGKGNGEQEAADDRYGNAVALQHRRLPHDQLPHEKQRRRRS